MTQSYQSMRELELLRHHPLPANDFPTSSYLRLRVVVIKYMADIVRELRLCRGALHLAVRLVLQRWLHARPLSFAFLPCLLSRRLLFPFHLQPPDITAHTHTACTCTCTCINVDSLTRFRTLTDWRIEIFRCTVFLPSRSPPFSLPSSLWNVMTKSHAPTNCASKKLKQNAFASPTCSTWKSNFFESECRRTHSLGVEPSPLPLAFRLGFASFLASPCAI